MISSRSPAATRRGSTRAGASAWRRSCGWSCCCLGSIGLVVGIVLIFTDDPEKAARKKQEKAGLVEHDGFHDYRKKVMEMAPEFDAIVLAGAGQVITEIPAVPVEDLREVRHALLEHEVRQVLAGEGRQVEVEALQQTPDVGPIVARHVHTFFRQPHNREVIAKLRDAGVAWQETEPLAAAGQLPLSGRTFVLTGTLSEPRAQVKERLQALGAKAKDADLNRNKYVEFMELVQYAARLVDEEMHGLQTPWLSRKEMFGDFALAEAE